MRTGRFFSNRSIRTKLSLLAALNGAIALLLLAVFLLGYQGYLQRRTAAQELGVQATIVAANTTAALSFSDERAADEMLTALRGDPDLVQAAIYSIDGRLFACFHRKDLGVAHTVKGLRPDGAYFDGNDLLVYEPVKLDGKRIGVVLLNKSMSSSHRQMNRYMWIVFIALLVSFAVTLLIGAGMQRTITQPIGELSRVARLVSVGKDYSVRARRRANDEIGFLIDSFNEMLAQIESREQALRESEERYALAARGANDGLWDWKLTSDDIYFSSRWNQMLGYPEAGKWGRPEDWLNRIHPTDRARVKGELDAHRAGTTKELVSEYRMRRKNGSFLWVLSRGLCVRDSNGIAVRMAGSQTDITEGKIADSLTSLPNRLYFLDRLEGAIERTKAGGAPFAVLFLDLDRFKLVNDSMGHAAGDELLVEISQRLQSSVKAASDARNAGGSVVARLGGDEFAVLLNPVHQPSEAIAVATAMLQQLGASLHIQGRQMFPGVSIGIALSGSGSTPEDLLRNADTAMYHAKTGGKGRFELFDDGMRERAMQRLEIEAELRKAIDDGQLILHYQPTVTLSDGSFTGCEALVRWNHPQRGLIPPGEFIHVAEETDLIVPLGRWVMTQACHQMARWHRTMPGDCSLAVAVNVSFRQLTVATFVDDVKTVLAESGLPASCLKLEMTESTVMGNAQETIDTLRQLKSLGVGLEIDDFGTGYSSLSCLSRLPFDTLKIDRSFVRELGSNEESGEIVRTILELARSRNMDVIAEGVETREQLQALQTLNCRYGQGFYFSEPVSAEAVTLLFIDKSIAGSLLRIAAAANPAIGEREGMLELVTAGI